MTSINVLPIDSGINIADAIFEAWFSTLDVRISHEDAKMIYDAGVNVGRSSNFMLPKCDIFLHTKKSAIAQEEKLRLVA